MARKSQTAVSAAEASGRRAPPAGRSSVALALIGVASLFLTLLSFLVLPLAEWLRPATEGPLPVRPVALASESAAAPATPAVAPDRPPPAVAAPLSPPLEPPPMALATPPPPAPALPSLAALGSADLGAGLAVSAPVALPAPPTGAGAPAPAPAAVSLQTTTPGEVFDLGSVDRPPEPLRQPRPVYPQRAVNRGQEGYVDLRFTVERDGSVSDAEIAGAEPAGLFEDSARAALLGWRFRPGQRAGQTVRVRMQIRIRFDLD